jgi:hypothetical protein
LSKADKEQTVSHLLFLIFYQILIKHLFSIHIERWIESIEVFVIQVILNDAERITILTKSKRWGEALDTQGGMSILHFHRFFRFLPVFDTSIV